MSTQKFWKARPERFQRPRTKNTFGTASPQVAPFSGNMVGHVPLQRSRETLGCVAGCRGTQQTGGKTWAQVATRGIPTGLVENIPLYESAAASGQRGGIPALGDIPRLPGQALSNLLQLWRQPCLGQGLGRRLQVCPPTHPSDSRDPLPAPNWEKGNSSPPSALSKETEINLTYRQS